MEITNTKIFQAVAILIGFALLSLVIFNNKPEGHSRKNAAKSALSVETKTVVATDHQFILNSFGNVQPRTQSLLMAQVSGQIIEINPAFRDGGFFNKGDILVNIDDRDYQATVNIAKAELVQARLNLAEEQARANQALIDWERLGDGKEAPELVLRKPQLAVAKAQIMSAQANYDKAELNLERTKITAPYDGRVKNKQVDLGQFVNTNTQLANIFSSDTLEIRLPLKNSDLPFIVLPENFQNTRIDTASLPDVVINSDLGTHQEWRGKVVRTEAAIDSNSHQLYVVAQIQNPFIKGSQHQSPLKIGQYVTAEINGSRLQDIVIIPNTSIYQGSYVYVIEAGALQRREIELGFQNSQQAFVKDGLTNGDQLVVSPLGQVTSGTLVTIKNTPPTEADQNQPAQHKIAKP